MSGPGRDFDTYGTNYRSAVAQGNPAVSAAFTPDLPVAELYNVQVWLPYAVASDGGTARYTITFDGGTTNIDLAQTEDYEGYWFSIFTGRFAAGTSGSVRIHKSSRPGRPFGLRRRDSMVSAESLDRGRSTPGQKCFPERIKYNPDLVFDDEPNLPRAIQDQPYFRIVDGFGRGHFCPRHDGQQN